MFHSKEPLLSKFGSTKMFQTFLTLWLVSNFIMVECQKDCCELHKNDPKKKSGRTRIFLGGQKTPVECDMNTDGGGWTIIQRRFFPETGTPKPRDYVDFDRPWPYYEEEISEPDHVKSYWLGLKRIAKLTESGDQSVRFDMDSFYVTGKFAKYNRFKVHEGNGYKLDVGDYDPSSDAGDSLTNATNLSRFNVNGMEFKTKDKANGRCATAYKGGWWFNCCGEANPNGIHHNSRTFDHSSITWASFDGYNSLKRMRISIGHRDKTVCGAK